MRHLRTLIFNLTGSMTMTGKAPSPFVASFLVTALVLSSQLAPRVEADCDAAQLMPCLPAFGSPPMDPSPECCARLKEQQPCFCGYMRDRRYSRFVKSPRAREILEYCKIPYPQC